MAHLKNTNRVPPGGWFYTQPDTGFTARKGTLVSLIAAVAEHRNANSLERTLFQDVKADIESQICERMSGTRSLWRFCDGLKTQEPPYTSKYAQLPVRGMRVQQPAPVARITTQASPTPAPAATITTAPKQVKTCPTCRKRKQQ